MHKKAIIIISLLFIISLSCTSIGAYTAYNLKESKLPEDQINDNNNNPGEEQPVGEEPSNSTEEEINLIKKECNSSELTRISKQYVLLTKDKIDHTQKINFASSEATNTYKSHISIDDKNNKRLKIILTQTDYDTDIETTKTIYSQEISKINKILVICAGECTDAYILTDSKEVYNLDLWEFESSDFPPNTVKLTNLNLKDVEDIGLFNNEYSHVLEGTSDILLIKYKNGQIRDLDDNIFEIYNRLPLNLYGYNIEETYLFSEKVYLYNEQNIPSAVNFTDCSVKFEIIKDENNNNLYADEVFTTYKLGQTEYEELIMIIISGKTIYYSENITQNKLKVYRNDLIKYSKTYSEDEASWNINLEFLNTVENIEAESIIEK